MRKEEKIRNEENYMGMEKIRKRMRIEEREKELRENEEYMWKVEIGIEKGNI